MMEPGSQSILLVEDNLMNQGLIVRQLARLGYEKVAVVGNGKLALEWLASHTCHLVLADCQMPVMDGYEMTRRIRENERTCGRRTPIIAVSAGVMDADVHRCAEAGMDAHIPKPTQLSTLRAVLSKWLGGTDE
ncbi:response regulator [Noviherbaspirillum galbum]|uniref:Response regulator n=1 Tax=Noviherbaspirillum galbum TaxID=2709383 RepID=A0A6B3SVD1_9BURK|nr:response regulator [Noviherbaspirillum galbum]NEX62332.1 response regulator [Noviherbaspirillum galbum]